MLFPTFAALLTLAAAAPVSKREITGEFGLMTLRSASAIHFNTINENEEHLHVLSVGGKGEGSFTLSSDGYLKDHKGRNIGIDATSGEVGLPAPGAPEADNKFGATKNGQFYYLTYDGHEAFVACPSGVGYSLTYNSSCTGGLGASVMIVQ